ncbi:MAG: hypothetical protein Phyf2KO_08670 [Phycisphaerales bacterium]
MSSIGAGIAASVSAIGAAERAAVAKKATEKRDEAQVRKQLQDRFDSALADVEETSAVVETQQDDESPADDRQEHKPSVHAEQNKAKDGQDRPSLDIQA